MTDLEASLGDHQSFYDVPIGEGRGVYAYFAVSSDVLVPFPVEPQHAIYVGMTESSLQARCRFDHVHSGFSTLRRSLGAILKEQLGLVALPRAPGPSRSNTTNYRFTSQGEALLNESMKVHLRYAHQVVDAAQIRNEERRLIAAWQPLLNLKGWRNPRGRSQGATAALRQRGARQRSRVAFWNIGSGRSRGAPRSAVGSG